MPYTRQESIHLFKNIRGMRTYSNVNTQCTRVLFLFYQFRRSNPASVGSLNMCYDNIKNLLKRGYICRTNKDRPAQYRITLYGRCKVITELLGIDFLKLCILTEAYIAHKSQLENRCTFSYTLHSMFEIFSGIYERETIQRQAKTLCRMNLADSVRPNVIQLSGGAIRTMSEFDDTLQDLHRWIVGVLHLADVLSLGTPDP